MSKRRNPFPGVGNTPAIDRHGKKRWRLRTTIGGRKIDAYLPGAYGSPEFRQAYHDAINSVPELQTVGQNGTFDFLITHYRGDDHFRKELAKTTRYAKGKRLDWMRATFGAARYADLQSYHIENLMDRKGGPDAANRLLKEIGELYAYARRKLGFNGPDPTQGVNHRKTRSGGYHTWTEAEVEKFREFHPSGSKARLALELILGTGAARQDACRLGRHSIKNSEEGLAIYYRRLKTGQDTTLPLIYLPELQVELRIVPAGQQMFLLSNNGTPYTTESFGNWFADQCRAAGLPDFCRAHGLRKHGAARLAERGANEMQIMAFLAHKTTQEALRYTREASRKKMAAAGLALLHKNNLPNLANGLGKDAV